MSCLVGPSGSDSLRGTGYSRSLRRPSTSAQCGRRRNRGDAAKGNDLHEVSSGMLTYLKNYESWGERAHSSRQHTCLVMKTHCSVDEFGSPPKVNMLMTMEELLREMLHSEMLKTHLPVVNLRFCFGSNS